MIKMDAYRFGKDELSHINIWQGEYSESNEDTWGNDAYVILTDGCTPDERDCVAPDFDAATTGDFNAINILIPTEILDRREGELRRLGFIIELSDPPTAGHYGDGGWSGVELIEYNDEEFLLVVR